MTAKPTRGGRRPGAGRPKGATHKHPDDRRTTGIKLSPNEVAEVDVLAAPEDRGRSDTVMRLVRECAQRSRIRDRLHIRKPNLTGEEDRT